MGCPENRARYHRVAISKSGPLFSYVVYWLAAFQGAGVVVRLAATLVTNIAMGGIRGARHLCCSLNKRGQQR